MKMIGLSAGILAIVGCDAGGLYIVETRDAGIDTGVMGLADGAPCDFDAQCMHDRCIPSKSPQGSGRCFSAELNGCIVVTDPSEFKKSCPDPDRVLYTCGDAFDVSSLGASCEIVGVGDLFEYYHCCPKP